MLRARQQGWWEQHPRALAAVPWGKGQPVPEDGVHTPVLLWVTGLDTAPQPADNKAQACEHSERHPPGFCHVWVFGDKTVAVC